MRRIAGPAIVIALAMMLLHSGPSGRDDRRHPAGAVERISRPIERDLQHAIGNALRR
jgi:hypothetical protein